MADEEQTTGAPITLRDVGAAAFIKEYAAYLKNDTGLRLPKWADVVKTGIGRELAPYDEDWFYVRAASVARKVYMRNGVGVGALRRIYGTAKNNGVRPEHFSKASGAVIRAVLKALTDINVVEEAPRGGRRVTRAGQQALDRIAGKVAAATAQQLIEEAESDEDDEDDVEVDADADADAEEDDE